MIIGIQDVYYNVQDMKRSVEFYRELLNSNEIEPNPYFTVFLVGGIRIGLHWNEGESVPKIPGDSHGAHAGATLTLKSNDLASDRAKLVKMGAKIISDIDAPWGKLVVFEDPDGNVLKLMQN